MSQRKTCKRAGSRPTTLNIKIARPEQTISDETPQPATTTTSEHKLLFAPGRYLVYSQFKGQFQIHVREYNHKTMSNGMGQCEYPTKKGVCFTPGRLKVLINKIEDIDGYLNKKPKESEPYKTHLGAGIYASIDKFNGIDLRRHWIPEGQSEIIPTRRGIYLPVAQWNSLKDKLNELQAIYPELDTAQECFHDNQLELIDCRECLPFGWMMA